MAKDESGHLVSGAAGGPRVCVCCWGGVPRKTVQQGVVCHMVKQWEYLGVRCSKEAPIALRGRRVVPVGVTEGHAALPTEIGQPCSKLWSFYSVKI